MCRPEFKALYCPGQRCQKDRAFWCQLAANKKYPQHQNSAFSSEVEKNVDLAEYPLYDNDHRLSITPVTRPGSTTSSPDRQWRRPRRQLRFVEPPTCPAFPYLPRIPIFAPHFLDFNFPITDKLRDRGFLGLADGRLLVRAGGFY